MVKIKDKEYMLPQAKVDAYTLLVKNILDIFADEVVSLALNSGYTGKKVFRISDYPKTQKAFYQLQRNMAGDMRTAIVNGATALWEESNFRNNKLAQSILGNKAKFEEYAVYFNNNAGALNSFLKRQRNGLNLSQRIWKISDGYKDNIESAITLAIKDGKSAQQLSRDVRQYLQQPDKLFRRIAEYDESGKLKKWHLSKPALEYSSGTGMYRSSYKNALRLASTEINMAYRTADQIRWSQMDFVVGYEVKRSSTNPYDCPLCDALAGKYPKSFSFASWHPHCRCYAVPILKTDEEMDRDDERIMSGKKPLVLSESRITSVPAGYKKWVADNSDRIRQAQKRGTLPFFLRENPYSEYLK